MAHLHQVHSHRIVGGRDAGVVVAVWIVLGLVVGPARLVVILHGRGGRLGTGFKIVATWQTVVVTQAMSIDARFLSRFGPQVRPNGSGLPLQVLGHQRW